MMATDLRRGVFTLSILALFTTLVHAQIPRQAKWSSESYGPDGPWQAVEVEMGNSMVALFPGHRFQSWVVATDYCRLNTSNGCFASKAGTFNTAEAFQDGTGSDAGISYQPPLAEYMLGMDVRGSPPTSWVQDVVVQQPIAGGAGFGVANVSLTLVESQMIAYPGGQWFPVFAGCLGVGAPNTVNQSFTTGDVPINGSLIPGMLWSQKVTPSNSFGMHIGSASSKMEGSLWFGGYDSNRVVGEVLTSVQSFVTPITLKDINIDVVKGSSPFNFTTTQSGLLATGNDTMGSGLPVSVDGCSPYLTLPKSTCDNIASHLPVTYNSDLGLYIWDTKSPKYNQIVLSASVLTFTFLSDSNTKTISIRVPFVHLNLTLTPPLVDEPKSYFPCFTGGMGTYSLGRAFLQDAFIGANWGEEIWWLAQAPGPNIQLTPRMLEIKEGDLTIQTGKNDWEASWDGIWKPLTQDEASGTADVGAPVQTAGGLSAGAKAGIAVGSIIGAMVIGAVALFWWRRKARENRRKIGDTPPMSNMYGGTYYGPKPAVGPYKGSPAEVQGTPLAEVEDPRGDRQWMQQQIRSTERQELPG
jgi:hypothetical protein